MLDALKQRLRALFQSGALNREMSEEMELHLARATERLMARGLTRSEAEAAARREFGNVAVLSEEGRDARGGRWLETLRADVRYGLRTLRASPAFTTVAVLSLAIGIGANTAIFSLINAVLLRSLPVHDPAALLQVTVRDTSPLRPGSIGGTEFTNPQWEALRGRTQDVASYVVSATTTFDLSEGGEAHRVPALWINGDFFNALGVNPVAGRLVQPGDDYRGCPAVVAVSEGFFETELGGRTESIGTTIPLNGLRFRVIGVVPRKFGGIDVGRSNQLYAPICSQAIVNGSQSDLDHRSNWWLRIVARPKRDVTAARLAATLRVVSPEVFEVTTPQRYDAKAQQQYRQQWLAVVPGATGLSDLREHYSRALLVLMGMVGLLLLVACANVANLLLARGAARGREIAIRIAIGASRARVVRQFLTESLLLGLAGTTAGIILALWASRSLVGLFGSERGQSVSLDLAPDPALLGFAIGVCLATVAIFGLAPALRATRVNPQAAMKAGGRGEIEGQNRFGFGKSLIVAQSALALILVVGAGLLVTTFRELVMTDKGFDPGGVIIAGVDLERTTIPEPQRRATLRRLRASLTALPGVEHVAAADIVPTGPNSWNDAIAVEGAPRKARMQDQLAWFNQVDDGYFATLRTRVLSGRDFNAQDTPSSAKVAIVNATAVRQFFGGNSPIGRVFWTEDMGRRGDRTIVVGVVEDSKYQRVREQPMPIIYLPYSQDSSARASATFLIRTSRPVSETITRTKAAIMELDRSVSLRFSLLSDLVDRSIQREKVLALLSAFFGSLALVLATIGLYGLMAYTVARRRAEIGIRAALGATRGRIMRLVLGDVGRLVCLGILIGGAIAFYSTTVLAKLLYGVGPRDPRTMAFAAGALAFAGLVAGFIPATRAASLQVVDALRGE